jgi:mono/diheme cytochrome c family protein
VLDAKDGKLRKCASATIALGGLLSFITHVLAQDTAVVDTAKVEAGENVYNTYCQVCHGDRLVSTGQTFDLRRLRGSDHSRFENAVRNGKNQMPPWKGVLSNEEIDQVWLYIRANAYQK